MARESVESAVPSGVPTAAPAFGVEHGGQLEEPAPRSRSGKWVWRCFRPVVADSGFNDCCGDHWQHPGSSGGI